MLKVLAIYLAALALTLIPSKSHALSYSVEWPESTGKEHILAITINECKTTIKVKTEDLEDFSKNAKALKQALEKALERANNGCK